ncbi:MAG: hypothetical protein J1E16_05880 [Muribaculaceae bacterium]|nr:hypothetical protein [Muribaculaceae bacterium]
MERFDFKLGYDSIIYFDSIPITILDDQGKEINIYGILYNRQTAHEEDLYLGFFVNRYICYLMASEIIQQKGGQLAPDFWELPNGNKITLQLPQKNLIYRIMRDRMLWYRIIETDGALDLKEDEYDGNFLISKNPLLRMGIEVPQNKRELEEAGKEVKA